MDDPDLQMDVGAGESQGSEAMEYVVESSSHAAGGGPDAEMELHETVEASEMRDAMLEGDAEMAAEMHEQELKSDKREWADRDAEQEIVDVAPEQDEIDYDSANGARGASDGIVASSEAQHATDEPTNEEQGTTLQSKGGDGSEASRNAAQHQSSSQNGEQAVADADVPTATDTERQDQADEVEPVQYDADEEGNAVADPAADDPVGNMSKPPNEAGDEDEDRFADVPVDTNKAALQEQEGTHDLNREHSEEAEEIVAVPRPAVQKDPLAYIDIFSGQEPYTPHVSMVFNNASYSLFRPSSTPSGDDEAVLLGDEEGGDHELYYSPLETLIHALHEVLPEVRGDGENEVILDFGPLDMQVSEDNVYASQLSLYDFDRIRVGMCQPELERLSVNLIVGKRLVHRFNELAEHCYRMYTGNDDDDSGTLHAYDDTDAQTNGNDAADGQFPSAEDKDAEPEAGNSADIVQKGEADGQAAHKATAADHAPSSAAADSAKAEQVGEEHAEDVHAEAEALQSEIAHQREPTQDSNEVQTVDPDASLEEAAEQAEEYEEAVYEDEEAAEAEGAADADPAASAGDLNDPDVSRPTKNLFRSEEEPQYYENLDSLAGDEEVVLLDRPDASAALEHAAQDLDDLREAQQEANDSAYATRSNSGASAKAGGKRGHDALHNEANEAEAEAPVASLENGDAKRKKVEA